MRMLRKEAHSAGRKMAAYTAALRRECALLRTLFVFSGRGRAVGKRKRDGVAAVSGRGPLSVGNLIKFSDFCDGSQ